MTEELKNLYANIHVNHVFKDMEECKNCSISCSAPKWISWLLPDEVDTYKKYGFNLIQSGKANFFKDGHCHKCKEGVGCTIYDERSLECRLTPLTVLKIENELWWILTKVCPIIKNSNQNKLEEIILKVNLSIDEIETAMTQSILEKISDICDSINNFTNLHNGEDYIKVRKIISI
ncbi:MAG: hypothetical protein WCV92_03605 [Candidatus Buchananbacteria bacterium]